VPGVTSRCARSRRGKEWAQRREDRAVGPVQGRPGPGAAQCGLVPQYEQFRVLGRCGATEQDQPVAEPDEDQVEQAKGHGRSSCATAGPGTSPQLTAKADFWTWPVAAAWAVVPWDSRRTPGTIRVCRESVSGRQVGSGGSSRSTGSGICALGCSAVRCRLADQVQWRSSGPLVREWGAGGA
jgi:hypothetical protein